MSDKSDRRDFNRFPIEFVIKVAAEDSEGKKFNEMAVLNNISGGGARFISRQAGKYFLGQPLEMTIYLSETGDAKARMRGRATVVRIDPPSNSGIGNKSQEIGIAVFLHWYYS